MQPVNRRKFLESSVLAAGGLLLTGGTGFGAVAPGVETRSSTVISGDERNAQPNQWLLEVNFKPVRMISVEVPDPATGKSTRQLIWYMCYRAINRAGPQSPTAELEASERPMFVPEFTLITDDNGKQKVYFDRVMPIAQAAINQRERHRYKNSVEIVGPLPAVTAIGAKVENSLDGVAMWRGVDPSTDFFEILMAGFSNGYQVKKLPDESTVLLRKTLKQKFWRPSDHLDQNEDEIRQIDSPQWIYR